MTIKVIPNAVSVDVDTPSDAYRNMEELWALPDILMDGERTLKEFGRTYLPQHPRELDDVYTHRLLISRLFNVYRHTVKNLTGRVFSNDIILNNDVPGEIRDWWENIDLQGNDGNRFFRAPLEDGINKGLSHVYVDFPRTEGDLTLAEEKERRPYCVHVPADHLIKAVAENVNGKLVLARAHIKEPYTVPISRWSDVEQTQIRVLYPGRWELYRKDIDNAGHEKGRYALYDTGTTGLDFIPLYTFYANEVGFHLARPMLEDLAYLNLGHYQLYSDYRNILHVANVPILYATGFNEKKLSSVEIGPNKIFHGPKDSTLAYVEHNAKAIPVAQKELEATEARMAFCGLEPLIDRPDRETYGAHAIDTTQSNSQLYDVALRLQDTIGNVLGAMAAYRDLGGGGSVVVNQDFGLKMRDKAELSNLVEMAKLNLIPLEQFYEELKRRKFLSKDFDIAGSVSSLTVIPTEKEE